MARTTFIGGLALCAAIAPAGAQDLREFSTRGLPGSAGVVVRVQHPAGWKRVAVDDQGVLAELRGPQDRLTGILQVGRGRPHPDMASQCRPERARTMLQALGEQEPDARVTDVFARRLGDRPAYEVRYERNSPPEYLRVRSVIVCLKDSKLVVSCGAAGRVKAALAGIEPVCGRLLETLSITEE
ncbi:MAG TPA: hypothetical protein VGD76_05890 [Ramlibacter sp.]